MKDGALLGKWPMKNGCGKRKPEKRVALTGDEKKAIMDTKVPRKLQTEDVLREQRDQALQELANLRREKKAWEGAVLAQANELKLFYKIVEDQEKELKAMKELTLWKLVKKKIADWILA